MFLRKKSQSTLEYTVLIALIAAAVVVTQTYIKRSVQGKLKASADEIGAQFSPNQTYSDHFSYVESHSTETVKPEPVSWDNAPAEDMSYSRTNSTHKQVRYGVEHLAPYEHEEY